MCLTCEGSSLNCTSCDNTFRLNNACLTRCPDNYYAENNTCHECTPNVRSCSDPLTFETEMIVEDYQQALVLKFSEPVNIRGNPKEKIKIKVRMKRRMMASIADLVNNGLELDDIIVYPDGTVKILLDPGISLNDVTYEVIFTDSSAITTSSGATLQNLESSIEV